MSRIWLIHTKYPMGLMRREGLLNLLQVIARVEALLDQDTDASVTYAALECRLAIEAICYERLKYAHDYISSDDIKKWQPAEVVNTLIKEVDASVARSFTLSMSVEPVGLDMTHEELASQDWLKIGTQIGFDAKKIGKLWHSLANLGLHVQVPKSSSDEVNFYGAKSPLKEKISDSLHEFRRLSNGNMIGGFIGSKLDFECQCGALNIRRLEYLVDGQTVNCVRKSCNVSYVYSEGEKSFTPRELSVTCKGCGVRHPIPRKEVDRLKKDQVIIIECVCGVHMEAFWRFVCVVKEAD